MKFSALVLGAASLMGAMAQAPFSNNTQAAGYFSISVQGGGFSLTASGGFRYSGSTAPTQGTPVTITVAGAVKVGNNFVYAQVGGTFQKRQNAAVTSLTVLAAAPANSFTTVFAVSQTGVVSLTNNGQNYAFGLSSTNILVAYTGATPAGITAITLTFVQIIGGIPTATVTSTAATAGAVQTVTTTVAAINNVNVNVNVAVTVIISPLSAPLALSSLYAIPINGVIYYVSQTSSVTSLTSYSSFNGVAITSTTAVVIVSVVPIVVPAVQVVVVSGVTTTLVGAVTTVATVTTIQNAGAATTTIISIRPATTVIATSTIAVTAGAAVVTVTGAAAAGSTVVATSGSTGSTGSSGTTTTTTTGGLPVVSRVSGADKLGMSALAVAAVAMALAF